MNESGRENILNVKKGELEKGEEEKGQTAGKSSIVEAFGGGKSG